MKKKLLSVILVTLLICLVLPSCTEKQAVPAETDTANNTDVIADSEITPEEPEKEETPLQEVVEEPAQETELFENPLTGLYTEKDLTTKRPIAVMVNNIHLALPQIGISEADIVYEMLEEGGITRLLAIYNDYENIPEIGSVRSARDYYIDIADAHDAIFIHSGGSTYAIAELAKRKTDDIDGIYMHQFYRSAERRKTMATEHTLMISGEGLVSAITQKGYRTTSENPCPLVFSSDIAKETEKKGQDASYIEIPFSLGYNKNPYAVSFFEYNAESGEYLKGHFEKDHIDGDDGQRLSFKNVLTIECPSNMIKGDPLGCIQVHFTGKGKGTYAADGTQREIVWERATRTGGYTLYESDGVTPLTLCPGKSYIAVVPTGTEISVK